MNINLMDIAMAAILLIVGMVCFILAMFYPGWFAEYQKSRGVIPNEQGRVLYIIYSITLVAFGIAVMRLAFK